MAIFKVTTTGGTQQSINSMRVSRVLGMGDYRSIWSGVGNTVATGTTKVGAKDSLAKIQEASGLALVGGVQFIGVDKALIGENLISRILDWGDYRSIWFGPGQMLGVNGSRIDTKETLTVLCNKLSSVVKVTDATTGRKIAVTSIYVTAVRDAGDCTVIQMGSATAGVHGTRVLVKESVKRLETLSIF